MLWKKSDVNWTELNLNIQTCVKTSNLISIHVNFIQKKGRICIVIYFSTYIYTCTKHDHVILFHNKYKFKMHTVKSTPTLYTHVPHVCWSNWQYIHWYHRLYLMIPEIIHTINPFILMSYHSITQIHIIQWTTHTMIGEHGSFVASLWL